MLTLQHPGGTTKQSVQSRPGQPLPVSLQLPYRDGEYHLKYLVGDRLALEAVMVFQHRKSTELNHQLRRVWGDPSLLHFPPDQQGIRVTVGFVEGKLLTWVNTRAAAPCQITIGLDRNGDGTIDPQTELEKTTVSGTVLQAETPEYLDIPLVARYEMVTTCNKAEVAASRGLYNFVQGESERIDPEKYRDPRVVVGYSVRFSRLPKVALVAVPNEEFVPQMKRVPLELKGREETVEFTGDPAAIDLLPTPESPEATPKNEEGKGDRTLPEPEKDAIPPGGNPPPQNGGPGVVGSPEGSMGKVAQFFKQIWFPSTVAIVLTLLIGYAVISQRRSSSNQSTRRISEKSSHPILDILRSIRGALPT